MHLAIDGYGSPSGLLASSEIVLEFLDKFPERIAMTKISEPSVQIYRGPVEEDWGVSGFVIIAESHISVHTFPDRNYLNVDVFSCKEFDIENAKKETPASQDKKPASIDKKSQKKITEEKKDNTNKKIPLN